jgi:hypothetical protein
VEQAVLLAKKQKLTIKQIRDLRKDLLTRWTDLKRQVDKA